jgi:CPA1 family monovalent cation:H+ antiporter
MDAETRQTANGVWSLLIFWLNGIAFVLLGLQFPGILAAVRNEFTIPHLLGLTAAVAGAAMLTRLIWIYPAAYLPFLLPSVRRREQPPGPRALLVVGWAGMRGTVTLAAALSIPFLVRDGVPFPERDLVIFLAFGVIVSTLAIQGTTLEWLIRRLGIEGDEDRPKEERLARMTAVEAGLTALRDLEAAAATPDQLAALGLVVAEYESRLSVLTAEGETKASARRRRQADRHYRLAALQAERRALNELWRRGAIIDDVHHPLTALLDHEETLLAGTREAEPA